MDRLVYEFVVDRDGDATMNRLEPDGTIYTRRNYARQPVQAKAEDVKPPRPRTLREEHWRQQSYEALQKRGCVKPGDHKKAFALCNEAISKGEHLSWNEAMKIVLFGE